MLTPEQSKDRRKPKVIHAKDVEQARLKAPSLYGADFEVLLKDRAPEWPTVLKNTPIIDFVINSISTEEWIGVHIVERDVNVNSETFQYIRKKIVEGGCDLNLVPTVPQTHIGRRILLYVFGGGSLAAVLALPGNLTNAASSVYRLVSSEFSMAPRQATVSPQIPVVEKIASNQRVALVIDADAFNHTVLTDVLEATLKLSSNDRLTVVNSARDATDVISFSSASRDSSPHDCPDGPYPQRIDVVFSIKRSQSPKLSQVSLSGCGTAEANMFQPEGRKLAYQKALDDVARQVVATLRSDSVP